MRWRLALVASLAAACSGVSAPTPTPAGMDDAIANLVLRGITVHRLVSGDPGCPGADLHDNAVRLEVSLDARSATHEIYLMRWRRTADFQAAGSDFETCTTEYQARHPGTTVASVEVEPWRAYGPGWPADLQDRLRETLLATSRN